MRHDNVIELGGTTTLDISPDQVLEKAVGEVSDVMVIGKDNDGYNYFASSTPDIGKMLLYLERCKQALMEYEGD